MDGARPILCTRYVSRFEFRCALPCPSLARSMNARETRIGKSASVNLKGPQDHSSKSWRLARGRGNLQTISSLSRRFPSCFNSCDSRPYQPWSPAMPLSVYINLYRSWRLSARYFFILIQAAAVSRPGVWKILATPLRLNLCRTQRCQHTSVPTVSTHPSKTSHTRK